MADQDTDDPSDDTGNGPKEPDTQPTDAPAQVVAEEPTGDHEEKVQQVKHSDFKRIKEEARAKGRREAAGDLDDAVKAAGFSSLADALKEIGKIRTIMSETVKEPAPKPAETPQPKGTPMPKPQPKNEDDKARLETMKLQEERAKMRKQWRLEERRRRELQSQLDAKEAEMGLREELYRAGVTDVDYALRLLTRQLEGKSEQEMAAFKRAEFYDGLKKEKPYLFGEKVVPATTGTNGAKADGATPQPPAPGDVAVGEAQKTQFDARTAKPQDIQKRLRELNLNPHA
jgi:hypothetical protein